MLLKNLLENAVQHSPVGAPVVMTIDTKHLSVRDEGPGLPQGWDPDRSGGIGIQNTRERLQHLYGDNHMFAISGTSGSGVLVEIEIPCQHANSLGQTVV